MAKELLVEGLTGGIGGLVGRTVAFPFDTLKVKLATLEGKTDVPAVLRQIVAEEGLKGFYRGLGFSAFEALYQKSIYVLLFNFLKKGYMRLTGADTSILISLACGYWSDLASAPFSLPIEALVVRLQHAPADANRLEIIRQALFTFEGVASAMSAGKSYFVLSLKPGIEFGIFDFLKRQAVKAAAPGEPLPDLSPSTAFVMGAIGRAIGTMVLYPFNRGKSLAMAGLSPSVFSAVRQVLRTEGIRALYKGLAMELMRGVTQAAIMFAVMERLRATVRATILGSRRQGQQKAIN
eukprot:gnl/TRDRNA2_/TRDRNA2_36497_c0_seq1.p1 gnl/TRDRNA2_/TRDRNA2_36497_c0~~gnl/TRDRNA2_/TRDRNA2_36497_c0_seq1.p1  ORF type:complete len:293 (-),score=57.43 gnl/TRDRNA2_/TRDRNA2_36497_c0_seq1:132-1010(-)